MPSRPNPQPQRQSAPAPAPAPQSSFYDRGVGRFTKNEIPSAVYNQLNPHARSRLDSGSDLNINPGYYRPQSSAPAPSASSPSRSSTPSRSLNLPVVNTVYQTVEVPGKKEAVKYGDSGLTIGDPEGAKRSRKAGTKKGKKKGLSQFDTSFGSGGEPVPLGLGVSSGINIPV